MDAIEAEQIRKIEEIHKIIGDKLRICREKANMSQTELGEVIGVSFQQIQKYEKGTNRIPAGSLFLMAKAMKVTVMDLYPTDEEYVYVEPERVPSHARIIRTRTYDQG